jgi:hypothetical protein
VNWTMHSTSNRGPAPQPLHSKRLARGLPINVSTFAPTFVLIVELLIVGMFGFRASQAASLLPPLMAFLVACSHHSWPP